MELLTVKALLGEERSKERRMKSLNQQDINIIDMHTLGDYYAVCFEYSYYKGPHAPTGWRKSVLVFDGDPLKDGAKLYEQISSFAAEQRQLIEGQYYVPRG